MTYGRRSSGRSLPAGTASGALAGNVISGDQSLDSRRPVNIERAVDIDPNTVSALLGVNDLDREIWREELEEFVPHTLFDMHSHLWRVDFNLDPMARYNLLHSKRPNIVLEQNGRYEALVAADAALMPSREVTHLIFGDPHPVCLFDLANDFVAAETKKNPANAALMMVEPAMSADEIDAAIRRHRFVGFKPYLYYAANGDAWDARLSEFMPEHQLAVANRYGLMIGMHLSKKAAIADPENLEDLERFTSKYPRVRWVLFHNARSYSAWPLERAASRLKNIPNLWYESSSVCETDAFDALLSFVDPKRFCYGSDDFPVGVTRGKYTAWGHAWAEMNETNQTLSAGHCDGRLTFVRYEMLRAMRRAAKHAHLTPSQIEDVFYNNGASLIASIQQDLAAALG